MRFPLYFSTVVFIRRFKECIVISPRNWKRWFSFLVPSQSRPVTRRTRLLVEQLEDRWVPSSVLPPTVDLTTAGSIGQINGAIFRQADQQPSGSGVIDSFVRLKAPGNSRCIRAS